MSPHENSAATGPAASPPRLPATLRLGAVHLTVSGLDRSVAFYRDAIGLRLHRREDPVAAMGAGGEDLVVLHEERGAPAATPACTTTRCCTPRAWSLRARRYVSP